MKFVLTIKIKITVLFIISCIALSFAQNSVNPSEDILSLSYEELYEIIVSDADSLLLEKAYKAYVEKAKQDKDTLELAQAFRLKAYNLNFPESIKSVDSSISIAKNIESPDIKELDEFMAFAYYTKGALYYEKDLNYKAIEQFIKSYELIKNSDNKRLLIIDLLLIADIKAVYGEEDEAVVLQRRTLSYLKKNKSRIDDYESQYLLWTEQMVRTFLFAKKLDSAAKYIDIGISMSNNENLKPQLRDFRIQQAKLNFYLEKYKESSDTLTKYLNENDGLWFADDLFYLGMIEGELGNFQIKQKYFLTIDSVIKANGYPLRDNFNEVYQFLLKQAVNDGNTALADDYLNRVVYYDSLLLTTQKNLREITLKKFDLPMQEEEKQLLGNIISLKSKWLRWFYIISGVMLIGLTAYYIKFKKTKKRLAFVMDHSMALEDHSPLKEGKDQLDEEMVTKVLQNLDDWEKKKGFLENSLTQQTLAKELNTNSSYLSKVINNYKNQNFASYLKDVRITYAINHLKENPEIVKTKSMIQIAEMYGFNSLSVFTKAFKDKTGVTPGVFFKRILEDAL